MHGRRSQGPPSTPSRDPNRDVRDSYARGPARTRSGVAAGFRGRRPPMATSSSSDAPPTNPGYGTSRERTDRTLNILAMFEPSDALHDEFHQNNYEHVHEGHVIVRSQLYRVVSRTVADAASRDDELYSGIMREVFVSCSRIDGIRRRVVRAIHLHDHFLHDRSPIIFMDAASCGAELHGLVDEIKSNDNMRDDKYSRYAAGVLLEMLELVVQPSRDNPAIPQYAELYERLIRNPAAGAHELLVVSEIMAYPEDRLHDHLSQIERIINILNQMQENGFPSRGDMAARLQTKLDQTLRTRPA